MKRTDRSSVGCLAPCLRRPLVWGFRSPGKRLAECPRPWGRAYVVVLALTASGWGWTNLDIGSPSRPGSASYEAGTDTWTVRGDGHDIWDTRDAFHYVYKRMTGDGEIIARLPHIDATHKWAKAGLMIRETLEPDSRYAFMALTPYGRTVFQYRPTTGGLSRMVYSDERHVAFPQWVKLVREGDMLAGYYSVDGRIWMDTPGFVHASRLDAASPAEISMPRTINVGLAVTSHSEGILCQADFDRVTDSAQPDLHIRHEDELDYTGDNIHDGNIAELSVEQTRAEVTGPDISGIYLIRLENDGPVAGRFAFFAKMETGGNWMPTYVDLSTGTDITFQVSTAAGWTTPLLTVGGTADIMLTLAPTGSQWAGDVVSILMRARSATDGSKVDTARTTMVVDGTLPPPPWSETYTTREDFEKGVLVNVTCPAEGDRLELSITATTLPYIWVPNTNEGTVSKINTITGRELGRYRICPEGVYGSPSRTTVDREGNCWVGNRACGTVVKMGLLEKGQYEDRNGNDIVETSRDLNGDGRITGAEVLAWGEDECVLHEVVLIPGREHGNVPGVYRGGYSDAPCPRALAVDRDNNIWAGCYNTSIYYYICGTTGEILKKHSVGHLAVGDRYVEHTPYGAVVDANGVLWSSGQSNGDILRLHPSDDFSYSLLNLGHFVYGLGLHPSGYLFVSGYSPGKLSRIRLSDPNDITTWDGFPASGKGCACTGDGDVWIAHSVSHGFVTRCTQDGQIIKTIRVGQSPTGVAIDGAGKVWVVDNGDDYIHRIDPNTNRVDLSVRIRGTRHYGYSDMTGHVVQNYTTKTGAWTILHNARVFDSALGGLWWDAETPEGTLLKLLVRSSNDQHHWSVWQEIQSYCAPCGIPPGRYFQVRVVFEGDMGRTPTLHSLTLCFEDPADCVPDYVQ